jgi:hypothetical protein
MPIQWGMDVTSCLGTVKYEITNSSTPPTISSWFRVKDTMPSQDPRIETVILNVPYHRADARPSRADASVSSALVLPSDKHDTAA